MKSKVSTEEDVDEFVLLNERIRSPITHTHTHMHMHRNSLVALIEIILFIKMLKGTFLSKEQHFVNEKKELYEIFNCRHKILKI
jgi:hypothetical protein